MRDTDTAARLGGDEFAVVIGAAEPGQVGILADRILASLSEPFRLNEGTATISVSLGVALCPDDAPDADGLMRFADTVLYRAKQDGRNAVRFFQPGMDAELRLRRRTEEELRFALRGGQLSLAWQPLADADGEVRGFEVLLRWHHPTRGAIPPAEFIPIAEQTGLMLPIGEWVLREACREAARWPNRALRVSVNISPMQFTRGDLPDTVAATLADSGLAPARLELEVTESLLLRDVAQAIDGLKRLKEMGVRIAMDDFGTGYSSLATLHAFPFDKIKVDRSFVKDVHRDPHAAAIVRAVLGLGQGLRIPVLAEGVEEEAQLEVLRAEGCDEVQGWLIGRPVPIAAWAHLTGRREAKLAEAALVS